MKSVTIFVSSGVRLFGVPYHPTRLRDLFEHACKAAGVPSIRLHDLRHTNATAALQAGIHPTVVQERLGHSSIAMTLDTYSHVAPTLGCAHLVWPQLGG